jgi:CAAX prenyl protease-like protein
MWPRVLPFALFMVVLAVRGAIVDTSEVLAVWLYFVQAALPAALMFWLRRRYSELGALPNAPHAWFVSVLVGVAVFVLWINATAPWMRIGEPLTRFVPESADGAIDWSLVGIRMAGAVLVVPIMEELFWRSFLMRRIDAVSFLLLAPRATSAFALVASSAVFALAHDLWLAGFCAGLAYGYLYMRTGQLWCAVAAHLTTNLCLAIWVLNGRHWQFW